MVPYRLLALDLDGTTLTEDKKITDNTRLWIRHAVEAGVTVIFSTGRGIQTAGQYWEELQLEAPMVMLNGAEIWKSPGRLWERNFLTRTEVRCLYDIAMEADAWFWGYSVESLTNRETWSEEMFEREWMKFGIRHDDPAILESLRGKVHALGTLEVTCSAPVNMEISSIGITKESGVRKVCELLDIGMKEVMAIGDHHNDVSLIRAAGLGIAMGNAEEKLKLAADAVTETNEREGVALAIQRYLLA